MTHPTHRRALCATLLLAALPCPVWAENYGVSPADTSVIDKDVRVTRNGDAFSIDVVVHAPVPVQTAWEVLTDFEHMARYQSNLRVSEVLERSPQRLLVRQKGVAGVGPFRRDFESVREMKLTAPRTIQAQQVRGSTLKRMNSLMTLDGESGGTRLTYHADIEPETGLPPLFGPAFVQHETAQQFSAMVREMVRRSGRGSSG